MLIRRLKVSGLLSFGPSGIDLPMEPLNVLMGPNGSGKSNLLQVLALLRAAPKSLAAPVKQRGGIWEWLWKGKESPRAATVEAIVERRDPEAPLRHTLTFTDNGGRLQVTSEEVAKAEAPESDAESHYRLSGGQHALGIRRRDSAEVQVAHSDAKPGESVLSQIRDPGVYPALNALQEQYERIHLYQNWSFGPTAALRRNQSAHGPSDFLKDGAENLAIVLSHFRGESKRRLVDALHELFDGIVDVSCPVTGGTVALFLEESGGRQIPATLLSDGTLRYLSLLAILLHPAPPPLIALEEPELGLHPDIVAEVAKLLVDASERTQLVVTTHSRVLVDALMDHPSSVVVCEKENGESRFERLDGTRLKAWLDQYSVGEIWRSGELGAFGRERRDLHRGRQQSNMPRLTGRTRGRAS